MLGCTSEYWIKMNNGFKNSVVTFTKKRFLNLKIKFKTRSTIIYEGSDLIDDEADYCCSQRLSWLVFQLVFMFLRNFKNILNFQEISGCLLSF